MSERTTMPAHERLVLLRMMTKKRADKWSKLVRMMIEPQIVHLQRDAETEEERRDIRRLWDLMNDICEKHARKAAKA